MPTHYQVTEVRPTAHLALHVKFYDGLTGDVEFEETHLYGVFEVLKNPHFFSKVHCQHGYVEWPGKLDIAPDAMYEEIKKHGNWVLR